MKKLIFVLSLAFVSLVGFGQVDTLNTVGGGFAGGDSRKAAYEKINDNDLLLEDRIDSAAATIITSTAAIALRVTYADSIGTDVAGTYVTGHDNIASLATKEGVLTNSAGLLSALSDETGTGLAVFSTSPTLVTPALGTPSALVGTNISGTGASFTAGTATLATTVTITDNENTAENNPLVFVAGGDLDGGSLGLETDGDAYYTPSTGTLTAPILSLTTSANLGTFGDATQIVLSEASSNTNPLVGIYPMVNFAASANKVFAGAHSRLLLITTAQTNDATMVGMESQVRVKGVSLGTGVHAGIWAYAEQSGTTVLSGGGTFDAINATIESASAFSCGATEHVTGITVDCSLNGSAGIDADANFSGIYIKSNGLDWKTGIKITGVDSVDIEFQNGAFIYNSDADTLTFVETNFSFQGAVYMEGAALSDFAITDEQVPLLDYWAKTQELNRLPSFENVDRRCITSYVSGLEETTERLLRYIVDMENRIKELESKLE